MRVVSTTDVPLNLSNRPEYRNFMMNIARTMLHFYDFQKAPALDAGAHKMKFEWKRIEGITYKIQFDYDYLWANGKLFYSHTIITSLVTTLECYFEGKIRFILNKMPMNASIEELLAEYVMEKKLQRLDVVLKLFKTFQIDIFKDVDRNLINELFERRHIIIHRGGFLEDEKTYKKFNAVNAPVGVYYAIKEETLQKYIDTVISMVSSIERQSLKFETLPTTKRGILKKRV